MQLYLTIMVHMQVVWGRKLCICICNIYSSGYKINVVMRSNTYMIFSGHHLNVKVYACVIFVVSLLQDL